MEAKEKKIMIWIGAVAVIGAVSVYFLSKASAASKTTLTPKTPMPIPNTTPTNQTPNRPNPVVTDNLP